MRFFALLLSTVLFASPAFAQAQKNFVIVLDGVEYPINLDEEVRATGKSGQPQTLKLKRKEFAQFSNGPISFEHKSDLSVASTKIDDGVMQHMSATATGSLVLLQSYEGTKPSELIQLMVTQLTEDDVKAGAKLTQEDSSRTLADGTVLSGKRLNLKASEDDQNMDVLAYDDDKGGGILAITSIDVYTSPEDQPIIDRFWATLKVK